MTAEGEVLGAACLAFKENGHLCQGLAIPSHLKGHPKLVGP